MPEEKPVHFAARTAWERRPNALSLAWERRLASGAPADDLTESNPTRCGFRYPAERILRALADPRALRYEPHPRGLPLARERLAAHLDGQADAPPDGARGGRRDQRRDQRADQTQDEPQDEPPGGRAPSCHPDRLVLTASTSEAYAWLFKLLCERGDRVLIPRPSYPLFDFLAGLEEVELAPYPLRFDGRWRLDLAALAAAVDERTRAVVVVHPNNPTGNALLATEAAALGELCARRGLAVISDEVFLEYLEEGAARPERLAGSLAAESPALTFSLGGLSKSAGLPQIKAGWIRAGGPDGLVEEALGRLEVIADTYLSVNTPAQWALPELLAAGREVAAQILARVRGNRRWLETRSGGTAWQVLPADGGWSAVLRLPRIRSEEEWCLLLAAEEGVLLHPGFFFDFPSEAYLVASLLPEERTFRGAMERACRRIEAD